MRRLVLWLAVAAGLALPAGARAAPVELVSVGTFSQPTYATGAPGDASRLYVVERAGTVKVLRDGATSTFVDLTPLVRTDGERGLLSIAFAPDFATSRRFYAYYSAKSNGDIIIARFVARDADSAPASPEVLLDIPHDKQTNHNGGQLQFGPDGYLYAGTGDGGQGDDHGQNGQNLNSFTPATYTVDGQTINHNPLLGKLLRLDVSPARGYTTPAANAFGPPGTPPELFAYGMRNPYRFSFDAATGDLLLGDVGQGAREEVDLLPAHGPAGANLGWSRYEGTLEHPAGSTQSRDGLLFGSLEYAHSGAGYTGCSVIGGYVVRDPRLPELAGQYVYADYCTPGIRAARVGPASSTEDRDLGLGGTNVISFGEDACGRVLVTTQDGTVQRLSSQGGCELRVAPGAPGSPIAAGPVAPPAAGVRDTRAPVLTLRASSVQRAIALARIRLTLSCDELCDVRARGEFLVGSAKPSARRRLAIQTRFSKLDAKARVRIDLRSSRQTRHSVARSLRRHRKVVARVELRVRDTAQNVRTTVVRIRVRR